MIVSKYYITNYCSATSNREEPRERAGGVFSTYTNK